MPLKSFTEGDIELTLPDSAVKLDELPENTPDGMKLADFYFRHKGKSYLIELKDPSHPNAVANRKSELKKIKTNGLIKQSLVPKARGSYTWLHLMKKDDLPIVFIALLGTSALPDHKALLLGFKDELLRKIENEAGTPWCRKYIKDCVVVSDSNWDKVFQSFGWKLKRRNAVPGR